MMGRQRPPHIRAPVVADHMRLCDTQMVKDADGIGHQGLHHIGIDIARLVAVAEPALVERDYPETGTGKRLHLMAP